MIEYSGPGGQLKGTIQLPWGVATGIDQGHIFPTADFSLSSSPICTPTIGMPQCTPAAAKVAMRSRAQPGASPSPQPRRHSALPSKLPEAFEVQFTGGPPKPGVIDPAVLTTDPPSDARIGYIRITRFSDGSALGNTEGLVNEFARLLTLMDEVARDGLILDLRSNPGGDVQAAEQMLQMLDAGGRSVRRCFTSPIPRPC